MKRWTMPVALVLLVLCTALPLSAQESPTLFYEDRQDIPEQYRWDLTPIFENRETFEQVYNEVENMIPDLRNYKGSLDNSPGQLATAMRDRFMVEERYAELLVYASQTRDLDTRDPVANDMYQRVNGLGARLDRAVAFFEPEITQLPVDTLRSWMQREELTPYGHYLDNLLRTRAHVRSTEVEEVIAQAGPMAAAPFQAWSNLTSADITWPTITDPAGEERKVVPALYYSFVADQDRRIRRDAALALFGTYSSYANTFAATYNGQVQRDRFYAGVRDYNNTLEMVLDEAAVPEEVIENLMRTVHDNRELMHRYVTLRKKVLGIDEFHVYDLYVPLVAEAQKSWTFEEAREVAMGFWRETYGEEYASIAERAFEERWIDVYAAEGKRGGAYSWGTYNSVPYLLLNWGGTLEDVFTLVHEMGHSVHTFMTNTNQPYQYSEYSLFVAEVASVASEALFLEYMLERTEDPAQRLDLLNLYLNNITGTFLRQVFFHEFEARAHAMADRGEALTKESLGEVYGDLWEQYYGPELVLDPEFEAGWARVSHFYRTFYVWVYATSFAAGEAIADQFRGGNPEAAVEGYLKMLKLGGSVYPMDALKTAGVDLKNPTIIRTVMNRYDETLSEMERLFAEREAAQQGE